MNKTNVMVCVTKQKTCERLILSGHDIVNENEGKLYVVHVVNEKENFLEHEDDGEALEYLFAVSKESGANLTVLRSKDVPQAMVDFANKNNITHMIMGKTPTDEKDTNLNFPLRMQNELPNVDFLVI